MNIKELEQIKWDIDYLGLEDPETRKILKRLIDAILNEEVDEVVG